MDPCEQCATRHRRALSTVPGLTPGQVADVFRAASDDDDVRRMNANLDLYLGPDDDDGA